MDGVSISPKARKKKREVWNKEKKKKEKKWLSMVFITAKIKKKYIKVGKSVVYFSFMLFK